MEKILGFNGNYVYLSNFYKCEVYFEGIKYSSVENAYQSAKTLDVDQRLLISNMTASESKKYSKNLVIREDWENIKYFIMFDLVFQKFYKNYDLMNKLLLTGDSYIEESNWWGDIVWGVCNGVGENKLGKILMQVRTILCENKSKGFIL